MKKMIQLCLVLMLILPLPALAELPEQVKSAFAPISGVIIMPVGEEYLVDLDASSDLREGDILTLVAPGEKIIHPVTKEVLGSLDVAKGYLQVTRIKSGYSYARLLTSDIAPAKGDQVKRFEQVPAAFTAAQSDTELTERLKRELPHLNWLDDSSPVKPLLFFTLANGILSVTSADGVALKTYQYTNGQLSAAAVSSYQPGPFSLTDEPAQDKSLLNKTVGNLLGSVGIGKKDERLEAPGIIQARQQTNGVWMTPNLDGNPAGLIVGDFDNDGQQETAVAMEDRLLVIRISQGKNTQLASVDFPAGTRLLSIDSIDLDNNGFPEFYLTAASGEKLSSQVVEYQNGDYRRITGGLEWFLRVVDLPREGRTLIGQTMGGSERPFSPVPFRVVRSGESFNQGTTLEIPPNINLFSFVPFSGSDGNPLFAHTTTADDLLVTDSRGDQLWESGDHFGGSEVSFYNVKDINKELVTPVYIQQRLLSLPSGDILVAQNEGIRTFQRFRNFNKGRVVALKWNGFALQESWRTSEQNGYLADFAVADADNDGRDELVMAVKFQQKNIVQKGRSTVVIYELNP